MSTRCCMLTCWHSSPGATHQQSMTHCLAQGCSASGAWLCRSSQKAGERDITRSHVEQARALLKKAAR